MLNLPVAKSSTPNTGTQSVADDDYLKNNAENEIIYLPEKKLDLSALFAGGGGLGKSERKSYQMTFVPLSLGIKIRPDDEYYTSRAVEAYKVISQQLM